MAESYSPSTWAGSLIWKLFVSTTHWALARAQEASSMPTSKLDVDSVCSIALPLVEGAQGPSIITLPCKVKSLFDRRQGRYKMSSTRLKAPMP